MNRTASLVTALMALLALTACDSKTASLTSIQTASIHWDEIAANNDTVARAPQNANLIFMR